MLWGLCGWYEGDRLVTTADQAGTTGLRATFEGLGYKFKYVYDVIGKKTKSGAVADYCRAASAAKQLLCDKVGMVIWAEIPYISRHMPTGRENTISQMKELICQNYNHPSIVVWGLSNEISIAGSTDDLLQNHRILNDMCHEMDKTRLTTIAVVSMCSMDDPYLQIPDLVSYNHYFDISSKRQMPSS